MRPLTLVLAALLVAAGASAKPGGISGYSGKSGVVCSNCHSKGAAQPMVLFNGPTKLAAGEKGLYTFTISGGPASMAGFDIAVSSSSATLGLSSGGSRLLSTEVTQSAPQPFSGGMFKLTFSLTAPTSPGTVTLYGAGLSADGNGGDTGDSVGATAFAITIGSAPPPPPPPPPPPADAGTPPPDPALDAGAQPILPDPADAGTLQPGSQGSPLPSGSPAAPGLKAPTAVEGGCSVGGGGPLLLGLALGLTALARRRRR